jgi:hypothetical protein
LMSAKPAGRQIARLQQWVKCLCGAVSDQRQSRWKPRSPILCCGIAPTDRHNRAGQHRGKAEPRSRITVKEGYACRSPPGWARNEKQFFAYLD